MFFTCEVVADCPLSSILARPPSLGSSRNTICRCVTVLFNVILQLPHLPDFHDVRLAGYNREIIGPGAVLVALIVIRSDHIRHNPPTPPLGESRSGWPA